MAGQSTHPEHHCGLWQRLSGLFTRSGHGTPEAPPRLIRVWDAARGTYRSVNLNDRYDSLWPVANELALMRDRGSDRPAA